MPTKFIIVLCDPNNHDAEYKLFFNLNNTKIVQKWIDKVILAKEKYSIDDPQRFYGMRSYEDDKKYAIDNINKIIEIINSHQKIIDRKFNDIHDTDTLNYLHHIFEEYHGLLDCQNTEFWKNSPDSVKKALSDLNIAVHRVENVLYKNRSRFTVTYFGLPKTGYLEHDDYEYLTNSFNFGGLYLNYVEIGKTLEDLMRDNDQYIDDDAFQPWKHYSADFTVKLYDISPEEVIEHKIKCHQYYENNKSFFEKLGYNNNDIRLRPGNISLGQLVYDDKNLIFENIKKHQYVKDINFL